MQKLITTSKGGDDPIIGFNREKTKREQELANSKPNPVREYFTLESYRKPFLNLLNTDE